MSVWSKIYERINWKDLPQRLTALAARNLNKMDLAIDTLDDRTIGLNTRLEAVEENPITVDTELKPDSENPVQNKVIYAAFEDLLPEETVQGNPISINDASGLDAKACSVDLLPIQDLHGYNSPWAGGAGKNKAPLTLTVMKANNTSGNWNGNVYTYGNVSITVETTDDDYITEISFSGSISSASSFVLAEFSLPAGTYKFNGCSIGARLGTRMTLQNISVTPAEELARVYEGRDVEFTLSQTTNVRATFIISTDLSSGKFYPMIRLSSVADSTFAPYSNICPISGRTEVNLTRTGKNLSSVNTVEGVSWANNNVALKNILNSLKVGTYTLSFTLTVKTVTMTGNWAYGVNAINANGGVYKMVPMTTNPTVGYTANVTHTFTITEENKGGFTACYLYGCGANGVGAMGTADFTKVQIELGSSATEYQQYQGQTYTETLGQTVYGGKADFVSGEGQNDYEYINPTSVAAVSSQSGLYYCIINSGIHSYNNANVISSHFVKGSLAVGKCYITGSGTTLVFVIPDQTITTKEQANTWLQNNNVQFAIPLATPTEITLTAEQISLLKGNNVLVSDSNGNIKLTYSADIKAWVENQLSV